MIAVIATIRTKEGMGPQFEAAFAPLQAAVNANEPGNKLYQLTKPVEGADVYKVLEMYEDAGRRRGAPGLEPLQGTGRGAGPVHGRPPGD